VAGVRDYISAGYASRRRLDLPLFTIRGVAGGRAPLIDLIGDVLRSGAAPHGTGGVATSPSVVVIGTMTIRPAQQLTTPAAATRLNPLLHGHGVAIHTVTVDWPVIKTLLA